MTSLKIGDKAPDFTAVDQDGKTIKLSDYGGKKLVLFFYPRASTPTCTIEACNLRDNHHYFLAKGYEILGVSAGSPKRQANFRNKYQLPFSLLADEKKDVIKAYDVWGNKFFMGRFFDGIKRTTFVIDEKGIIEDIITEVKSKRHSDQILNENRSQK